MVIVSINMLLELNHQLEEKGLPFKVHLRDACGRQAMWVEELAPGALAAQGGRFYPALEAYFEGQGMRLAYSADRVSFWEAPEAGF